MSYITISMMSCDVVQVYTDIECGPETREFNSVLTARDMFEQMKMQGKPLAYYRIPINDDHAPDEEVGWLP